MIECSWKGTLAVVWAYYIQFTLLNWEIIVQEKGWVYIQSHTSLQIHDKEHFGASKVNNKKIGKNHKNCWKLNTSQKFKLWMQADVGIFIIVSTYAMASSNTTHYLSSDRDVG